MNVHIVAESIFVNQYGVLYIYTPVLSIWYFFGIWYRCIPIPIFFDVLVLIPIPNTELQNNRYILYIENIYIKTPVKPFLHFTTPKKLLQIFI